MWSEVRGQANDPRTRAYGATTYIMVIQMIHIVIMHVIASSSYNSVHKPACTYGVNSQNNASFRHFNLNYTFNRLSLFYFANFFARDLRCKLK